VLARLLRQMINFLLGVYGDDVALLLAKKSNVTMIFLACQKHSVSSTYHLRHEFYNNIVILLVLGNILSFCTAFFKIFTVIVN